MEDPQNIVGLILGEPPCRIRFLFYYTTRMFCHYYVLLQLLDAWVHTSMIHMKSCVYIYIYMYINIHMISREKNMFICIYIYITWKPGLEPRVENICARDCRVNPRHTFPPLSSTFCGRRCSRLSCCPGLVLEGLVFEVKDSSQV